MKTIKSQGASSTAIIVSIVIIIIIGVVIWYVTSQPVTDEVASQPAASSTNAKSNSNTAAVSPTAGWQTYHNNTYGYQLQFPNDWYYIKDAMSGPPPPATAFFSSQSEVSSANYASLNILVGDLAGETLHTWAEIDSLVEDGYTKTATTVDGYEAVQLERSSLATDTGGTIYVAKDNLMYRIVWGATDEDILRANEDTLETMVDSITFVEPLVEDFNWDGVLHRPAEEDDTSEWNLLYEEIGSPGMSAELIFDYQYIPSVCIVGGEEQDCSEAIADGSLQLGDAVSVSGYEYVEGKVAVFQLVKQ